jgi:hypothetical protein
MQQDRAANAVPFEASPARSASLTDEIEARREAKGTSYPCQRSTPRR